MDLRLVGKTALVTGASMGIGRAIARGLAAEGVQVAAVARRTPLLEELGRDIERAQGPRPLLITQGIMTADTAARLRDAALAGLGHIDILVNCAAGIRPLPVDAPEDYRESHAAAEIPAGAYGEPEDLAVLAVFFASPVAHYISGAVIPVDGGLRRYVF